jgi:Domain of unknown function (DUF4350)
MRQRLTIILTIVVIVGLLVVLNTLTYVKNEQTQDSELIPNRSTYHAGPTGTRALYDFLSESDYRVMRWRESPEKLLSGAGKDVRTFVIIGETQVPITPAEAQSLLIWVEQGGRLVIIDRTPEPALIPKSDWQIYATPTGMPGFDLNPGDPKQMTQSVVGLQPVQPTVLTRDVQTVMPSRFASNIKITEARRGKPTQGTLEDMLSEPEHTVTSQRTSSAPVVHIGNSNGALLIDYSYGAGRFVWLSDPYIVANGGISLKDNLQVAINSLAGYQGLIAFDEFHQGKAITRNAFASYFSGTPVIAIGGQIVILVLLILLSNARRFGRALPLSQVDRRSSLEFVASMSELQERSRAFDLAIENIYTRTRRVLARFAGVEYNTSRSEIAKRVAARSSVDAHQLETLMRQCEEAINGTPINSRQSVDLVRRLREVERTLGLRMRSREVRQAAEKI